MMSTRETAEVINERAAAWVVRIDRDNSPETSEALQQWLDGDRRRRGAYLRARVVWHGMLAANHSAAETSPRMSRSPRVALAAMLAGAAAIAATALMFTGTTESVYRTRVGEQSRQPLADGSVIVLNTASVSRVDLEPTRRRIELERGEALFDVAHDKARPFVVSAGPIRIEAVGTAFAVRRRENGAEIVVTQGRVRAWSERNPSRFISIHAGNRTYLADATGASDAVMRRDGIDQALAWKRGMIALDGMTLVDAAAEFNRYNRRQIAVDEHFADKRLVGWFEAKDIDGFARSAATVVGGRVEQDQESVRIIQ